MNKKIYIIAILAIVITTLSQTISFIGGEHRLYQTVQDKCTKCHGDIKSQLSASAKHSSYACIFCHPKSATNHTNTKPVCQDCHEVLLNDTLEAHQDFAALGSEGCIACHTTYNTIVNYSRAEYIDYDIKNDNGSWIVSNFTTIGLLNLTYNALREGGNHNLKDNVSCRDCHRDIFDSVSTGGHAIVLGKDGKQVSKHNSSRFATLKQWCLSCHNSSDPQIRTKQHSARKTTCDECHEAYGSGHPGNFFTNIKTVPHLYRSLVCISCKSVGWKEGTMNQANATIHFRVHQEPYFDVTTW
ncbi:MAG: hypothetical protein OIN66_17570 [Candidatus Methanoperedens sp.]|nr:hypothetical protein [Candidatus Methanoperedens sp.]